MDEQSVVRSREVDVSVADTPQSLDLLKNSQHQDGDADLVLTSFQLRKVQKGLIETLARQSGESQATIIRSIIDEWREMKLRGC